MCSERPGGLVSAPPSLVFPMSQKPESRLVAKILKELRAQGGWWFKTHGSPYQMAGIPDILGCHKGQFVALEIKMPGKEHETSTRQDWTMKRIQEAGGIATVVSSKSGALGLLKVIDRRNDGRD